MRVAMNGDETVRQKLVKDLEEVKAAVKDEEKAEQIRSEHKEASAKEKVGQRNLVAMQAGHMGSRCLDAEREFQRAKDAFEAHQKKLLEHKKEVQADLANGIEVDEFIEEDWEREWKREEEKLKAQQEEGKAKAELLHKAIKDERKLQEKMAKRIEKLRSENQRLRAEGKVTHRRGRRS